MSKEKLEYGREDLLKDLEQLQKVTFRLGELMEEMAENARKRKLGMGRNNGTQ